MINYVIRVINVPGMGGFCYDMDDDRLAEEDEMPKIEKIGNKIHLHYLNK